MPTDEEIVREALEDAKGMYLAPWELAAAIAALDRLVAEPREYRECWHCTLEDKAAMDANLLRVEAEVQRLLDGVSAQAEEARTLREALERWQSVAPTHRGECLFLTVGADGCTCGLDEARRLTRAALAEGGP